MRTMDVYLTQAARTHLRALSSVSSYSDGLLIGHKRGQQYIAEAIFSIPIRLAAAQAKYIQLDQMLEERILGFFTLQPNKFKREKLLRPIFMGKILLEIQVSPGKNPGMKAYSIDYKETFVLSPIKIKKEAMRKTNV